MWKEFYCSTHVSTTLPLFTFNNLIGQNSGHSLTHILPEPMKTALQVSTRMRCPLLLLSPRWRLTWESWLSPGCWTILCFLATVLSVCAELHRSGPVGTPSRSHPFRFRCSVPAFEWHFRYLRLIKERAGCPPYAVRLKKQ